MKPTRLQMFGLKFGLMFTLCAATGLAAAAVQVQFVAPEKYRDAVPDVWHGQARETDPTLKELRKHIEKSAARYFATDRTLRVMVLDIDLAGEIKHLGSTLREVRVLNQISWPVIKLRYEIEKDGRIETQGEETLSDPNYQDHVNRYSNSDALRYERRMLDEWLDRKFSGH